jgi:hypothetical protein
MTQGKFKPIRDEWQLHDELQRVLISQMEAQADDDTPSSIQREKGLVWLEGWFYLPIIAATHPTDLTRELADTKARLAEAERVLTRISKWNQVENINGVYCLPITLAKAFLAKQDASHD